MQPDPQCVVAPEAGIKCRIHRVNLPPRCFGAPCSYQRTWAGNDGRSPSTAFLLAFASTTNLRVPHPSCSLRRVGYAGLTLKPLTGPHRSVRVPFDVRTSVRGLIKTGRSPIEALSFHLPRAHSTLCHIYLIKPVAVETPSVPVNR